MTSPQLPIHAVLPDLLGVLRGRTSAVLIAPPGAGKTTAVAPALAGRAIVRGAPVLGTWQGVYLFEHRRMPHRRRLTSAL